MQPEFDFDPYDALIQLGRNQEDLYNRSIVYHQRVRDLQGMIVQQQTRMLELHAILEKLLERLDEIVVNKS